MDTEILSKPDMVNLLLTSRQTLALKVLQCKIKSSLLCNLA